jgi:hypothetical protein
VEELGEAWTQRQRRSGWRSVVPTALPGRGGEGRADGAVPGRFNVEEERGTHVEEERDAGVEAHAEDTEEGARWRRTWRRSGHRWVCGEEMTGLVFRGLGTLKKKNSSNGHDDLPVTTYELSTPVAMD